MLKENPKGKENSPKYGVCFSYSLSPSLCLLSWPRDIGRAVGLIRSSARPGFGQAERKHSQGSAAEKNPGKMLQKLLPQQDAGGAASGAEGSGGSISSHRAVNQKWQCPAPGRFVFYSSLYGSQSKQTVLLLIMKEVTLLIYLPTQMQDVIEQN